MSTTPQVVNLLRGESAFITALANSGWNQQAKFEVTDFASGTKRTTQTLSGSGTRALMTTPDGSTKYIAFGPYDATAKITITLSAANASSDTAFQVSNMLSPIDIATENDHVPAIMKSDTIIAQSSIDVNKNDCIATILRYKANASSANASSANAS